MPRNYTTEFKRKIVRLRLEEGRTIKSIMEEYRISKESIRRWCSEFSEECQAQSLQNPSYANEAEIMKENLRLRKELAEKEKEILFLKKAAAFFAREIDQRLIGLQNSIKKNLVFAGFYVGQAFTPMPIITTGNTGSQAIMLKKQRYNRKLEIFIMHTKVQMDIGA